MIPPPPFQNGSMPYHVIVRIVLGRFESHGHDPRPSRHLRCLDTEVGRMIPSPVCPAGQRGQREHNAGLGPAGRTRVMGMIPSPVYPAAPVRREFTPGRAGGINMASRGEVRPSAGGALARFVRRAERQVMG